MNRIRRLLLPGLLLAVATGVLAGCGGVRGSHSVSPASLFLPGLMKNDPPRPAGALSEPARA